MYVINSNFFKIASEKNSQKFLAAPCIVSTIGSYIFALNCVLRKNASIGTHHYD